MAATSSIKIVQIVEVKILFLGRFQEIFELRFKFFVLLLFAFFKIESCRF